MGNDNVEIQFKTTADTSGAQMVHKEVRNVTDAVKQAKPAQEQYAKVTEELSLSKNTLIGNLKQLGREIPGVSTAIALLKNGYVALGVAVAWAISAMRNYFNAVNEMVRNQELEQALLKDVDALQRLVTKFGTAADEFKKKLAEIGQATPVEQYQKWADQLKTVASLENEITQKTLERNKLLIEQKRLKGEITPEQAASQIRALELSAKGEITGRDARAMQQQYDQLGIITIPAAQRLAAEAQSKVPGKEVLAKAEAVMNDASKLVTPEEKQKLEKERVLAQDTFKRLQGRYEFYTSGNTGMAPGYAAAEAEKIRTELTQAQSRYYEIQGEWTRRLATADKAKRDFEALQKKQTEAQSDATTATQYVADLQKEQAALHFKITKEGPLKRQAAALAEQGGNLEAENKNIQQGQERAKRISQLRGKTNLTSGEAAELVRLQGEQAAANAPTAPPRPPNVSPSFRAVAEDRGYYIDPTKNAFQNNQAIAAHIGKAIELGFEDLSKKVEGAVTDVARRVRNLETRSLAGPTLE